MADVARGFAFGIVAADEHGVGVTRYRHGHDLKLQADFFRVTDPAVDRKVIQSRRQMQLFC